MLGYREAMRMVLVGPEQLSGRAGEARVRSGRARAGRAECVMCTRRRLVLGVPAPGTQEITGAGRRQAAVGAPTQWAVKAVRARRSWEWAVGRLVWLQLNHAARALSSWAYSAI